MFQNFDDPESSGNSKARTETLRHEMKKEGIDWYLVPHVDEQQNEYLPPHAERLAYISGFTGSAGFALIGRKQAHIFVDGRYTSQAKIQTDQSVFELQYLIDSPPAEFIHTIAEKGDVIGYDPYLVTIGQRSKWQKSADKIGAELKQAENLIDRIWDDQPSPPSGKVKLHPVKYAGKEASEKLDEIREILKEDKASCLLMTDPASLAWTFNIRGNDIVHNPLALGYAVIPADRGDKPSLFLDKKKLQGEAATALSGLAHILDTEKLEGRLAELSKDSRIHCDPNLVSAALGDVIENNKGTILKKRDPVVLLRAIKNEKELEGARNAHIRDGVACTKFLFWLDRQKPGSVDEITAAKKLENFRRETAELFESSLEEISFDTISGAGPNGALVHYRVTKKTNAKLENNSLYLVDSGGQYPDGTTDITRTVAIGIPPDDAIEDYTLVLKGHVAIALARFPEGTRGVDIDVLARNALWRHGKDYAHGTGHGVGSYLNVHEGPQSISKRGMEPLKSGMIISNEPGYYREGHYGIRIENLVIVRGPQPVENGKAMLGFETITLCPMDNRLIDPSIMTDDELHWLNAYHGHVRRTLEPFLDEDETEWLGKATTPLFRNLPPASA